MFITVAGYKGGIGKTTTAVHLAAALNKLAPTLLIDADENRSAISWGKRGDLPFQMASERTAPKLIWDLRPDHTVLDTKARPSAAELEDIASGCDLIILPTTTRGMDFDALIQTVQKIKDTSTPFKVLINMVPPNATKKYEEIIEVLQEGNIPVFETVVSRYTFMEQLPLDGLLAFESRDVNARKVWNQYVNIGKEILG